MKHALPQEALNNALVVGQFRSLKYTPEKSHLKTVSKLGWFHLGKEGPDFGTYSSGFVNRIHVYL